MILPPYVVQSSDVVKGNREQGVQNMRRQEAEKLIGTRVTAWTASNGQYVGELIEVVKARPWRGKVRITGVLHVPCLWETLRGPTRRRGFRPGEVIEVGGVNIRAADPALELPDRSYLEALRAELAQLRIWEALPPNPKNVFLPHTIRAVEAAIALEEASVSQLSMPVLTVRLASIGNPQPLPGVISQKVKARDFAEASRLCLAFIHQHCLGGGNWNGGQVYDDQGKQVAWVSYNGKVWGPGAGPSATLPLYEP